MFMNVGGYTAPAPVWPPKKTTSGMGMGALTCFSCGPGFVSTGNGFCVGVTPATRFASHPQACVQTGGKVITPTGLGLYLAQNFVTPQRLIAPLMSARIQIPSGWATPPPPCPSKTSGMGCCSSCANGGACEGHSHGMGMGQLFASGTDISGWGWGEWTVVGVGAAAGISLLGNVASAGKSIKRAVKRRRS